MKAGVLLVLLHVFFCQMSFLKSCLEMFLGQHGTEAWEEHLQAMDLGSIALVRPPYFCGPSIAFAQVSKSMGIPGS